MNAERYRVETDEDEEEECYKIIHTVDVVGADVDDPADVLVAKVYDVVFAAVICGWLNAAENGQECFPASGDTAFDAALEADSRSGALARLVEEMLGEEPGGPTRCGDVGDDSAEDPS